MFTIDIETYSELNIKNVGAYRYAEHESTRVTLIAAKETHGDCYVFDEVNSLVYTDDGEALSESPLDGEKAEEARRWMLGKLQSEDGYKLAHNAQFERTILKATGYIGEEAADPMNWVDTAALARVLSLPDKLEKLAPVFGVEKLESGKALISKFSKPTKALPSGPQPDSGLTNDPDWREFMHYNGVDTITTEYLIEHEDFLRKPASVDRAVFEADARINDRGVCVDTALARGAMNASDEAKAAADAQIAEATDGQVTKTTQRDRIVKFAKARGVKLPNLQEGTLVDVLANWALPADVRSALEARATGASTASKKYETALNMMNADGRVRGTLLYHGAHTGRWAGRGIQPQNLPRPKHSDNEIEQAIRAFSNNERVGEPIALAASCARGMLVPAEGKRMLVSDLSAIEGRVLAALAGEKSIIQAYIDADNGAPDVYKKTVSDIIGVPPDEVEKKLRNEIGKPTDLGLGFGGGIGAFETMAAIYGTDIAAYFDKLPREYLERAKSTLEWREIIEPREGFCDLWYEELKAVCAQAVVHRYRDMRPNTVAFWRAVENAFENAMDNPGGILGAGVHINGRHAVEFTYRRAKNGGPDYVLAKLPSGRYLSYPSPGKDRDGLFYYDSGLRQKTYGGKLTENIVQAVARDLMAGAMLDAEADELLEVLFTIHDEIVCEADLDVQLERLNEKLEKIPGWFEQFGVPLAAEGFVTDRFKKD